MRQFSEVRLGGSRIKYQVERVTVLAPEVMASLLATVSFNSVVNGWFTNVSNGIDNSFSSSDLPKVVSQSENRPLVGDGTIVSVLSVGKNTVLEELASDQPVRARLVGGALILQTISLDRN